LADQKPYALDRIVRILISTGILAGVIWMILGLTGRVFVVVQIIQDTILVPKKMGKVSGLNPAMMMLSLSIWGKLLGLLGIIIALPVTYLPLVYYHRIKSPPPNFCIRSRVYLR